MKRMFFLNVILASLPLMLLAQGPVASLTGEVKDPSGAAVPLATITVRNTATGVTRTAPTNQAGVYQVPGLQPGPYDITAEAAGFKREVRSSITLEVAQEARIDFALEIGAATETVNITAEAPVTDTESASTGTVIDNAKVVELPLNGRQFYDLAVMIPGTTLPAESSTDGFRGGFNVSGRSEDNNNFTVNGIDNNNMANGSPSVRPSIDDIQEFKVLTGVYSAEYGRSGGQVIVVTKSGTNALHGTVYEFLRNQKLDAANFFTQAGSKPSFRRNDFGATIGGPIIKNKTFFHFSYEGLRLTEQVAAVGTVPTAAEDRGDFSTLLTAAKPITIKNPLTGVPFANNQIPSNLINPVGQAILEQYPAPTSPTLSGAPVNNYTLNGNQIEDMNQYSVRIDHQFSDKDSLYGSYLLFYDPTYYVYNSLCGSNVLPNGGCYTGWTGQLFALVENHIFSPTLVNEARAGVQRMRQPRIQTDNTIDFWAQFPSITNIGPNVPNNNGVPSVSVTGYSKLGGPTNLPQNQWETTYDYRDTLSWQRGTHSVKFGGEFRPFDTVFAFVASGRGAMTFNDSTAAPASGYALADVLLGYPTTTSNSPLAPPIYGRVHGTYLFVLDDWKVTSKFTLDYGLRWEYNSPYTSPRPDQISSFNLVTGQVDIAGQNGVPNNIYRDDFTKFDPRLGFAYQPFGDSKTVIRGGSGIFSDSLVTFNGSGGIQDNYPIRQPATYTSSVASPVTLNNPFPLGSASGLPSVTGITKNFVSLSAYEWSLGIQRQLPFAALLDVTYFGSKGTNLPQSLNVNQPLPGPGTAAQVQARRPYPEYVSITMEESGANSHYESLQIKLEKRYSKGVALLLSETYAKSIDNAPGPASSSDSSKATPQNSYDAAAEAGLSDFNVKNRLVLSVVGELPFGKDKPWLSSGVGGKIIGGWQLSGILSAQTGRPWTPYFSANISNTSELADRPNAVAGCNPYAGFEAVSGWVNPACFTTPAADTFGDLGRNTLIGPGLVDLDFAVDRNFRFGERFRLEFRGELFNIFNHPNFNLPSTTYDSPSFGTLISAMQARQIQFGLKLVF